MEIKYNYYRKAPPIFVFNNEKFKQYPLNSRYYIGENGTVYCIDGFLVTQFINRNGYAYCKINEKNEAIHRLVAITYLYDNNYKNLDVNHKDGNKLNNNYKNLEWCTRSANIIHAFNNNLSPLGEDHPNSIYTNQEIENICKLLESGKTSKEISIELGYNFSKQFINLIYKIKHKVLWKHISDKYKI